MTRPFHIGRPLGHSVTVAVIVTVLCLMSRVAADIFLNGVIDDASEWTGSGVSVFHDAVGDVSSEYPNTGYDIQSVFCFTDVANGDLYFGIGTVGIAGDADGNGLPGLWGDSESGLDNRIDPADYGQRTVGSFTVQEALGILLDLDRNGTYDYVVGVPPQGDYLSNLGFYPWLGGASTNVQNQAYWDTDERTVLSASPSPSGAAPSVELFIADFPDLVASVDAVTPWDFDFQIVNGAFGSPIGEDSLLGPGHVPEPGTLGLGALVGVALLLQRRRRRVTTA